MKNVKKVFFILLSVTVSLLSMEQNVQRTATTQTAPTILTGLQKYNPARFIENFLITYLPCSFGSQEPIVEQKVQEPLLSEVKLECIAQLNADTGEKINNFFYCNNNTAITCSAQKGYGVWDFIDKNVHGVNWHGDDLPTDCLISPNGKVVATQYYFNVKLWTAPLQQIASGSSCYSSPVFCFTADSLSLIMSGTENGTVQIIELQESKKDIDANKQFSITIAPKKLLGHPRNNAMFASLTHTGKIALWNIVTENVVYELNKNAECMAFHPTQDILVFGTYEKTLCFWNYSNNSLEEIPLKGYCRDVQFSANGQFLAIVLKNKVTISKFGGTTSNWAASVFHSNDTKKVCFSSDDKYLAICDDAKITVWAWGDFVEALSSSN